jgi:hypothetical protein
MIESQGTIVVAITEQGPAMTTGTVKLHRQRLTKENDVDPHAFEDT